MHYNVWSQNNLRPIFLIRFLKYIGFHDCVSGCDGCINLDNAANNGLSDAIDFVEELYTEITDAGKVIIDESRGEVSLLEQDTIENVS